MKLRLTIILSGQAYEAHEFEDPLVIQIGRSEECEVQIDNLAVSRRHCEIVNRAGILRLQDLGSGIGTRLNGAKITTHNLNHGDSIRLGKFTIDVAIQHDQPSSGMGYTLPGQGAMTLEARPEALAKAQEQAAVVVRGYLELEGRDDPLLLESSYFLIGKDADAGLRTAGGFRAPRLAAAVLREEQGFRLLDLSPKGNAVRVNGEPSLDRRLRHQDQLQVRELKLTYFSGRPTEGEP